MTQYAPRNALVLVDIQNDYYPGGLKPLPNMEAAAANAARLLADARDRGVPVVHICHIAASEAEPFFRPGTAGSEIAPAVRPATDEVVVRKGPPNAFLATELEAALREAGAAAVTICGAMSQMCVDATARGAADLGFAVTVAHDACAAAAVEFDGVHVPAAQVHAAIMAPLVASYAAVVPPEDLLARHAAA